MRGGTILSTDDVPKYIREIVPRLVLDKSHQGGVWGYNWRLYGKWPRGYPSQLVNDCDKLLAWCRRWGAEAEVVERQFWYDRYPKMEWSTAVKKKLRNYIVVTITDPVALRFEKDGFYKKRGRKP